MDSNVLLDIALHDPEWEAWSASHLCEAIDGGFAVINPLILAEVSVGFATRLHVDAAFPAHLYRRDPLPYDAAFHAGKAFLLYRQRGGARRSPLPDFYIAPTR